MSYSNDWRQTAHNYVAKLYMEDVDREVYFEDVRLQMDTKLWGEEYNRHRPPKKVSPWCIVYRILVQLGTLISVGEEMCQLQTVISFFSSLKNNLVVEFLVHHDWIMTI